MKSVTWLCCVYCCVRLYCTTVWPSGDSFPFFIYTGLKQWPHKQHQFLSSCLLVSHEQNEILQNNIESSRERQTVQYYFNSIILSNNSDRLGTAWVWWTVPNQLSAIAYSALSKLPLTLQAVSSTRKVLEKEKSLAPTGNRKNDFSVV